MTRIAHLSDLHFGRHDPPVVAALIARLRMLAPDLVCVSGDFTQRARRAEFAAARAFLDALALPWLAVPGNHDVPLYDFIRRFVSPLGRYEHFISGELCPRWAGDGAAVQGINSARRMTGKNGRVSEAQAALVARSFAEVPDDVLRVVVTHHPLVPLPWGPGGRALEQVERGDAALAAFGAAGVHMLLAGHHHRIHAGESPVVAGHAMLVVQAGTATSTRTRDEANSFNLIEAALPDVAVAVEAWNGAGFAQTRRDGFVLADGRWTHAEGS